MPSTWPNGCRPWDSRAIGMASAPLSFSWVLDGRLAGCARLYSVRDFAFLASQGIRAVVRLTTSEEGALDRDAVIVAGLDNCHEPIRVLTAPTEAQLDRIPHFINGCVQQGKPVAMSCGAGYGPTGTILACYVVHQGWSAADAIAEVTRRGRQAYEVAEQLQAIQAYDRRPKEI
jgi:atypical dual specificity phosphatase